ncbi:MAG: DUF3108 domain-containing protein [Alphaproteobacteria bacterium]|nr:DUF3108 domain-containing protein [Alphaproteobacteria bacterium]
MKDILTKILILLPFFFSSPAQALSVKHNFTSFIGMFNTSVTEFTYEINAKKYKIDTKIDSQGMFDTLYPFSARYITSGRTEGEAFVTESYKYTTHSRFSKRSKELLYDGNGIAYKSISTKNKRRKIKDIPPHDDTQGTVDLQTAVAALAKHYAKTKNCNLKVKVFDGKRRFDMIFKNVNVEKIEANEYSPYHGEALKCLMYIENKEDKGDDLLFEMNEENPLLFWLMEDNQTKAAFVAKIKLENTPFGEMNVYTTKIEVKK